MRFRLYIVEGAPNSTRALSNFEHLAEKYLSNYELEVVDVAVNTMRALNDHILVTPALVRLSPPMVTIVGSLDDSDAVLSVLGLAPKE